MTLTLTTLRSFGSFAHAVRDASAPVARRIALFTEARRNRRAVTSLADFDDRLLKDIGLSRSEVVGALEVGFDEDPSALLIRDTSAAPAGRFYRRAETPARAAGATQGFAQGIA